MLAIRHAETPAPISARPAISAGTLSPTEKSAAPRRPRAAATRSRVAGRSGRAAAPTGSWSSAKREEVGAGQQPERARRRGPGRAPDPARAPRWRRGRSTRGSTRTRRGRRRAGSRGRPSSPAEPDTGASIAPMASLRNPVVALVSRFAAKLRYPQLFMLTAGLFLLDLVIPDVIPFADELLLGLGTLLLAGLKRRKDATAPGPASAGGR